MMPRWSVRGMEGLAVVVVIWLGARAACSPSMPKLQRQASALDTALARDTAQVTRDTLATDSALVRHGGGDIDGVGPAIHQERKSWKKALKTSQAQTKNANKQVEALTPHLQVFAELNYGAAEREPLLQGRLSARAGAILRLDGTTEAQLYVEKPLLGLHDGSATLNLGIRKRFRLF